MNIILVNPPPQDYFTGLTDFEVQKLKILIDKLSINECHLGKLAWFLVEAKKVSNQEQSELDQINEMRKVLYRPKIDYSESPEAEDINEIWSKYSEQENKLTEREKIERDRQLFKEMTSIQKISKKLSNVRLYFYGVEVSLETSYFLQKIQNQIKVKGIPQQLKFIISRIGKDNQNQTKQEIKFYKERQALITKLTYFLKHILEGGKGVNLLGGGILFIAGIKFPFQSNNAHVNNFNFENVKSNKRYADYFRDMFKISELQEEIQKMTNRQNSSKKPL